MSLEKFCALTKSSRARPRFNLLAINPSRPKAPVVESFP